MPNTSLRDYLVIPRASIAWNNPFKREDWTFDAEVVFLGQFIIQAGFKTREEALKVAEEFVAKMKSDMISIGKSYTSKLKPAKL